MILLLRDYVTLRRLHIYKIYDDAALGKLFVTSYHPGGVRRLSRTVNVFSPQTNKRSYTIVVKLPVFVGYGWQLNVFLEQIMLTKYKYFKATGQYDRL